MNEDQRRAFDLRIEEQASYRVHMAPVFMVDNQPLTVSAYRQLASIFRAAWLGRREPVLVGF